MQYCIAYQERQNDSLESTNHIDRISVQIVWGTQHFRVKYISHRDGNQTNMSIRVNM